MEPATGSFFEKAPGIIEASAKSPLALAALIILVLAFLAFFYFRQAKESTRTVIFVIMGIGGFTLLAALLTQQSPAPAPAPPGREQPPDPAPGGGKGTQPGGEIAEPRVVLGIPAISHGVTTPLGPGITIQVPGTIKDAEGQSAQLVINFNFPNGAPVWANVQEPRFRSTDGVVATGSAPFRVPSDSYDLGALSSSIPYYAFNMVPSGGYSKVDLVLTASVYLDGAVLARSVPVPFFFYW